MCVGMREWGVPDVLAKGTIVVLREYDCSLWLLMNNTNLSGMFKSIIGHFFTDVGLAMICLMQKGLD